MIVGASWIAQNACDDKERNAPARDGMPGWTEAGIDHDILMRHRETQTSPVKEVEAILEELVGGIDGSVAARRRRLRVHAAFDRCNALIDPLGYAAITELGLDAKAVFVIAGASRGILLEIAHRDGMIRVMARDGVVSAGVPIGTGIRLLSFETGQYAVNLERSLPKTIAAASIGRPLSELVTHPLIDQLNARIVSVRDAEEISPGSAVKGTIVETNVNVTPMRWRDLGQQHETRSIRLD